MKHFIAALVVVTLAIGGASAQAPATPVHRKAAPAAKHKKAFVKKERIKKTASF
jgi:hypothetical protein